MMPAGVLVAVATLAVGWVALLPMRVRLGAAGYHVIAIPVGVLGWSVVASVSMALRTAWSPLLVLASLAVWCGFVWLLAKLAVEGRERSNAPSAPPLPRWWTYAVAFAAVAAFAWLFAHIGVSAFSADGWSQYEPDGIILNESGMTTERALGNRMVAVSALHAAYHFFGGEFTHVVQPLLGGVTALLVALGVWWACAGRLPLAVRVTVSSVPALVMATNAVYAFHSVYIHSHMVSAMFLILAIVALSKAWAAEGEALDRGWLLVAGLATAGIVLARPDGAAYAVVPILVAGALSVRVRSGSSIDAFFWALLGASSLVVAGGVVQHGYWWTRKLGLQTLLLFFGVYVLAWIVVRWLSTGDRAGWLTERTNPLKLALALDVAGLVAVWVVWTESVVASSANMASNLFSTGGYRAFWPSAAAMVAVTVALRPRSARHRFTVYALFAIVQFLVIAFVLHGIRHPGRIGWGDSFTRVSFQVVPVIYLYVGLYLSEMARVVLAHKETLLRR